MVAEVAQVIAGVDLSRERVGPAIVLPPLVEHVGDGVHGPGVPGVQGQRALGQGQPLVEESILLEAEGVEPEQIRVLGSGR